VVRRYAGQVLGGPTVEVVGSTVSTDISKPWIVSEQVSVPRQDPGVKMQ